VCQKVFPVPPNQFASAKFHHPFITENRRFLSGAPGGVIEISPTVAFLVVALIVILLVYTIRTMSRN
jgi:uncharacterized membrane protein